MKSFGFNFFLLFLLVSFAKADLGSSAGIGGDVGRKTEVLELVARSILDRASVILIAESRYDSAFMPSPRPILKYAEITGILELRTLFPLQSIRGLEPENRIWVQIDPTDILERNKKFQHIPALASEGVWICFLRPVKSLPKTLRRDGDELCTAIADFGKDHSLAEVAEKFSFSSWLNDKTWFMPAIDFSIFQIDRKIRDLSFPQNLQKSDADQIKDRLARVRAISSPFEKDQFKFSELEVAEVIRLAELFDRKDGRVSIDDIAETGSEVGNEIIRQLALMPSNKLDKKLREVKESIPQSLIEKIFSEK